MAVDFQNRKKKSDGSLPPGTLCEDVQLVMSEVSDGAHAFVQHLSVLDFHARGYIRPVCVIYVTRDRRKLMQCLEDLIQEMNLVSKYLKAGSKKNFIRDVDHRISTIKNREASRVRRSQSGRNVLAETTSSADGSDTDSQKLTEMLAQLESTRRQIKREQSDSLFSSAGARLLLASASAVKQSVPSTHRNSRPRSKFVKRISKSLSPPRSHWFASLGLHLTDHSKLLSNTSRLPLALHKPFRHTSNGRLLESEMVPFHSEKQPSPTVPPPLVRSVSENKVVQVKEQVRRQIKHEPAADSLPDVDLLSFLQRSLSLTDTSRSLEVLCGSAFKAAVAILQRIHQIYQGSAFEIAVRKQDASIAWPPPSCLSIGDTLCVNMFLSANPFASNINSNLTANQPHRSMTLSSRHTNPLSSSPGSVDGSNGDLSAHHQCSCSGVNRCDSMACVNEQGSPRSLSKLKNFFPSPQLDESKGSAIFNRSADTRRTMLDTLSPDTASVKISNRFLVRRSSDVLSRLSEIQEATSPVSYSASLADSAESSRITSQVASNAHSFIAEGANVHSKIDTPVDTVSPVLDNDRTQVKSPLNLVIPTPSSGPSASFMSPIRETIPSRLFSKKHDLSVTATHSTSFDTVERLTPRVPSRRTVPHSPGRNSNRSSVPFAIGSPIPSAGSPSLASNQIPAPGVSITLPVYVNWDHFPHHVRKYFVHQVGSNRSRWPQRRGSLVLKNVQGLPSLSRPRFLMNSPLVQAGTFSPAASRSSLGVQNNIHISSWSPSSPSMPTVHSPMSMSPSASFTTQSPTQPQLHRSTAPAATEAPFLLSSSLLTFKKRFSFADQILISLLLGRPVIIHGYSQHEEQIRSLIRMLAFFVPGVADCRGYRSPASGTWVGSAIDEDISLWRSSHRVCEWQTVSPALEDLGRVKLLGLSKTVSVPMTVSPYCTLWDFEAESLWAPEKYTSSHNSSRLIRFLLHNKKRWHNDAIYQDWLKYMLTELGVKTWLYYHLCCLGGHMDPTTPATRHRSYSAEETVQNGPVLVNSSPGSLSVSSTPARPVREPSRRLLSSAAVAFAYDKSPDVSGHRVVAKVHKRSNSTVDRGLPLPGQRRDEESIMDFVRMFGIDKEIVKYLAELVKHQQAVDVHSVCDVFPKQSATNRTVHNGPRGVAPIIHLDFALCKMYKNVAVTAEVPEELIMVPTYAKIAARSKHSPST
eukprot:GILJ01007546.1.p1 GENE.GILJ01007546.1~~GILJ01007546.1.p1  ORF type:complete len:1256 (-),score=173.65 GILJ01007546.1:227-3838(-)